MPRKAFIADLNADPLSLPPQISELKPGEDDGAFDFQYRSSAEGSIPVVLQAMIPDVSEYPDSHSYFVYSTSDAAPAAVNQALSKQGIFDGLTVPAMLGELTEILENGLPSSPKHGEEDKEDSDGFLDVDELMENGGFDNQEDDFFEADYPTVRKSKRGPDGSASNDSEERRKSKTRLRNDLLAARTAGFYICCFGQLLDYEDESYLSLSCRISKLGIQEDALRAWNLDNDNYLVLLIHYPSGYNTLEELLAANDHYRGSDMKLKVVLGKKKKLPLEEVIDLFRAIEGKRKNMDNISPARENRQSESSELFIGRPLNELINVRLLKLIKYRLAHNLTWQAAEEYYNQPQSMHEEGAKLVDRVNGSENAEKDGVRTMDHLPAIATSDHMKSPLPEYSFPLTAMQFTIRHLVRCTKYCLVCHERVSSNFEALRPYVCCKPLCLYQYMSLGFGPSIDHEILYQPYVVDLLVSFCYTAADAGSLHALPIGLSLRVSPICEHAEQTSASVGYSSVQNIVVGEENLQHKPGQVLQARLDEEHSELIIQCSNGSDIIRPGQWLTIFGTGIPTQHRQVKGVWLPKVQLGSAVFALKSLVPSEWATSVEVRPKESKYVRSKEDKKAPDRDKDKKVIHDIQFAMWDVNFDDLTKLQQQKTICSLLKLLPTVLEMKEYLRSASCGPLGLQGWVDRIPPAAVELLRWIIASNRSCILQVDTREDKVFGMPEYLQFRFAQGAPDKEQRFIAAVNDATRRRSLTVPTIFSWHGSPLTNWHNIVREGLNFNITAHGRVYGNGVYHSPHANISLTYSNSLGPRAGFSRRVNKWPASMLDIEAALSLNEIVNVPDEFVHSQTHLVVAQLDWIQTRYLFVKCGPGVKVKHSGMEADVEPEQRLLQGGICPVGPDGKPLIIPVTAVTKSRRPGAIAVSTKAVPRGEGKSKKSKVEAGEGEVKDFSEYSDEEDLEVLLPVEKRGPPASVTPYTPGTLDGSDWPHLPPPSYATQQASKALQRLLKATLKVQENSRLHELGWFLDDVMLTNLYQWIFEIHSFEKTLPLAQDMQSKGLQSIIFEVRFGKDFPFSPPFVRVIRPRFRPFQQGGGGHVTAGGAMCMELLTNSGWNPASTMEAVMLQVRMALTNLEPFPARLEGGPVRSYCAEEAIEAYKRACRAHGWQVPEDFRFFSDNSTYSDGPGFSTMTAPFAPELN